MKIAWIGTGIMGKPMCMHLIKAGHEITVFNRSPQKYQELLQNGAKAAENPAKAAADAQVIFTIVGTPVDVEEVYLGQNGILTTAPKDSIMVDMTTSSPQLAIQIANRALAKGAWALDAPCSGGDTGAQKGILAIMVGGEKNIYDRVLPLFNLMGKTIGLMGPTGSGQHTKMSNQIAVAGCMMGVVEALLYAQKAGLDHNALIDIIETGAAGSWTMTRLGRSIAKKDFEPGFMIKHFIKDLGIILSESKVMNLSLPGLALIENFYRAAMAANLAEKGTQSLYQILKKINSM